jgi:hypothetical protein
MKLIIQAVIYPFGYWKHRSFQKNSLLQRATGCGTATAQKCGVIIEKMKKTPVTICKRDF